ncbi:multidrug ABC transporter permease [Candidatus Gracilibacteria bacterium]|jgi:ABC-2 type transport system permease protein|nr:multidrug ABC transporter permease [Candidatus Gracilibacteria bacterium]NJM85860.1 multidrug ABC transporter permease [Hydrococcus sp. RU_2_2]
MKWTWKKATTLLSTYYAHMLEYRAEIFLWALSNSLPLILMGVWTQAAQGGNFGFSSVDFARYFFSIFLIRQFTTIWVIWEFEREIVEGQLSFRLLQPLDPVWHHIARHLAEKMTRVPLTIALTVLFFWLYPKAFWIPSWKEFLFLAIATVVAFSLRFVSQYTFAMFAFWTERASAIEQFWFLFYIFLSGLIAPLEVFPPLVREIVLWTPFPYFLYFPAALVIGFPVNFLRGILIALGWGILFFFLNRWLWRRGLQQYSGMGA